MKLAKLVGLSRWMSSLKNGTAQSRIAELFDTVEVVSSPQEIVNADRARIKRSKQVGWQSERVKNYHHFEYYRGEDFIENVPYSEVYKYTVKDKINELKNKERWAIYQLEPIRNHGERSKLIKDKVGAYHEKQRKYQIEEFQKYLSEYPGTVRGPRPEDDWEAYREYGMRKIPKILIDEISVQKKIKEQMEGQKQEVEQSAHKYSIESPSSLLSFFAKDRKLYDVKRVDGEIVEDEEDAEPDNEQTLQKYMGEYEQELVEEFKTQVPFIPNTNFQSYQHFVNHWMNWLNFRNSYSQFNLKVNMEKMGQRLVRLAKSLDQDPQNQYMDLPTNIPSLSRYYRCLPKQLQDHPGLKDIYLGLQYSSPDYTYEDKEEAINFTCKHLLPFDDISKKIMADYTSKSKVYPTPYLFDKIYTISPEYTWDLRSFLQQIRRQELKGQTSSQNKELKFPQPPEVHKMWEEGCANLPVDYYDNQDGFWDSIISEKLRRYDAHKPMLKTRKHFTH